MSQISAELLLIVVLVLFNGVLAMSEAALFSARKARLQQKASDGDHNAAAALKLIKTPNLFLATVQVGITLVGVLAGAVGGASLVDFLAPLLAKAPVLAPYSETISLGLVVMSITFLTIILGELVPKRLALHNPEQIASRVARPMLLVSQFFSPIIKVFSASTELVLRLLGIRPRKELPVTEEELQVLLAQGTEAGVFEESESDMVAGVFRLGDRRVYSVMTPRTEIAWLDIHDPVEEIRQKLVASPFSRFPVCQGSLDNVLGIVKARDLLIPALGSEPLQLKNCLLPALFIPETAFASRALEIFKENSREMLLVIDEFGGLQGLVTITDILEEIVGDIETGEPQATQRQDGSWLLDGMLPAEDFMDIFNMRELPNEGDFETLGGFVMTMLGRIPVTADQFEWNGMRYEVVDMDGRRVDKVLVTTLPAKSGAD